MINPNRRGCQKQVFKSQLPLIQVGCSSVLNCQPSCQVASELVEISPAVSQGWLVRMLELFQSALQLWGLGLKWRIPTSAQRCLWGICLSVGHLQNSLFWGGLCWVRPLAWAALDLFVSSWPFSACGNQCYPNVQGPERPQIAPWVLNICFDKQGV